MRKTMVICDLCGKEIKTDPVKLHAEVTDRETGDCRLDDNPWPELADKDYHKACAGKLIRELLDKLAEDEADPESPPQREKQEDRSRQSNGIA